MKLSIAVKTLYLRPQGRKFESTFSRNNAFDFKFSYIYKNKS